MLFLVSGASKRDVLARVLAGEDLPAAHAYAEGEFVWLVDRDAAPPLSALQVRAPPVRRGRAESKAEEEPSVIVVMGVSGAGKSTIAAMLALRLGWTYEDADWFHPPSNVEKMHAGHPLTDEDRWPWLQGIAAWIGATRDAGGHGVIACSALKRAYRDILVAGRRDVRIVYLKGDRDLIARRVSVRLGHFMPAALIDSQFATLEEPGGDENAIVAPIDARPRDVVETIVGKLGVTAGSTAKAS
jgi:gluconokinase